MAGVISTQGFTFRLIAGEQRQQLDLFEDEDYVVSNNVTGLFDIGLLPSDFTRQITLPGTKVNNAFFEHVYDISITNPFTFATNQKVPAQFEFDSVYISSGYLQLNKVNVVANKFIDSYEVTIYGTLSSFGRDINRVYLTDLTNLSDYNHTASYDNISASWNGGLFNGDIVYPLADYGTGWTYTAGDPFFGVDDNEGAMSVQDFKPAIRAKVVLDKIFEYAGYTYSSSFFNEDWWNDVYMICNNSLKYPEFIEVDLETYGVVKFGAISGSGMTSVNLPDGTFTKLNWYNNLTDPQGFMGSNCSYRVDKETRLRGIINLNINISASVNNVANNWRLKFEETGSGIVTSTTTLVKINQYFTEIGYSRNGSLNQNFEVQQEFNTAPLSPGYYYVYLEPNKMFTSAAPTITLDPSDTTKSYIQITKQINAADGRVIDMALNMPYGTSGIKLIDFITGLQKKFNLVIYPDRTKPNHFIIETFNNWYNKGEKKDFNKYINLDETIEVIPANNLAVNKLNFGDTLDQDYISQQFSKGANREYGKIYYTDTTNYYSQGTLDVKTTFASSPLIKMAGTGLSGSAGAAPTCAIAAIHTYTSGYVTWTNCNGTAGGQYCSPGTDLALGCVRYGSVVNYFGSTTYGATCS